MSALLNRPRYSRRRGAIVVLVAFVIVIFLITAAFSVDVAYMQCVRAELRAATDAAAQAGVEALSRTQDLDEARQAAIEVAALNVVAGESLQLDTEDIEFGRSDSNNDGSYSFVEGGTPYNSVRVNGRRTSSSLGGEVTLFLGGILGTPTFHPQCAAVASNLDQDVCLVIDRSHSMCWDLSSSEWSYPVGNQSTHYCKPPHATESRWAANVNAVVAFLWEVYYTETVEHVGLVTFASDAYICSQWNSASSTDKPLSTDYYGIYDSLNARTSKKMPGGTNISAGIYAGVDMLTGNEARTYAQKTIIVMTDGRWTDGSNPVYAAQYAASQGIRVHTITFSDQADQDAMEDVAEAAGGKHFHAPDSASLTAIYQEIARTLPVVLTQ